MLLSLNITDATESFIVYIEKDVHEQKRAIKHILIYLYGCQ